jgi:hypothetical protein
MKTLKHGEQVKTAGCKWVDRITVGAIEGYAKEGGQDDAEATIQRAITNEHPLAWTNKAGYCITANYTGKEEARQKEMDAFEKATMLEAHEEVEIEGRKYHVRIMGLQYSDPIHFIPVK